jgi:hypothetical protein
MRSETLKAMNKLVQEMSEVPALQIIDKDMVILNSIEELLGKLHQRPEKSKLMKAYADFRADLSKEQLSLHRSLQAKMNR